MSGTPQYVYATNLDQNLGYPLRNPKPGAELTEPYLSEGLQIGDIGYVDDYGEFRLLFNVKFPPQELSLESADRPRFHEPAAGQSVSPNKVFMTGVQRTWSLRELGRTSSTRPPSSYTFTATSKAGAILILPGGATLFELENKYISDLWSHAKKFALRWCRYAQRDTLYLLTAVYKAKSWTLGSFYDGFTGGEIHVNAPRDDNGTSIYRWDYAFTVDDQQGPPNNSCFNQTVFVKGFKITARHRFLEIETEPPERPWRWLVYTLGSVLKSRKQLIRQTLDISQLSHPLDIVNLSLLDKCPQAQVAITHDDEWIRMLTLTNVFPFTGVQREQFRNIMNKSYTCVFDPEHNTACLERVLYYDTIRRGERNRKRWPDLYFGIKTPYVITTVRLENFDLDRVYAGACILVQFKCTTIRTKNKPHASIIEWDDTVTLPSDLPVHVTVCGVFQLGSTLGIRENSERLTIDTEVLSGGTYTKKFPLGGSESRSSLLVTLEQRSSSGGTPFIDDVGRFLDMDTALVINRRGLHEESDFIEKTTLGFRAFYSYRRELKIEYLDAALEFFRCSLEQCGHNDSESRATACFNLATAELVRCQADGTYSELTTSIGLYQEALKSRGDGHPDRPATLLLLAQAHLSRHGWEFDESAAEEIEHLLAEFNHGDSRERRAADAIMATCRFHRAINAQAPADLDELFGNLEQGVYKPPYGYFDGPHLWHKLGAAYWRRSQSSANLGDLDKAIELNTRAVYPKGHACREGAIACLGKSFLCGLEGHGELTDLDMSDGLGGLGKKIVAKLDDMSSPGAEAPSADELRKQIELISAADDAIQAITNLDAASCTGNPAEVQSLVDDWGREDAGSTPTKCKRQLAVLLSFLGGDGEAKMRKVLEELDFQWSYKGHKIAGTVQAIQEHMPYFHGVLALVEELKLTAYKCN